MIFVMRKAVSSKWEVGSWEFFRSILSTSVINNEKLIINN